MTFILGLICGGAIVFAGGYLWLLWLLKDSYR